MHRAIIYISILFFLNSCEFWEKDKCLDNGGKWDYEKGACSKSINDITEPKINEQVSKLCKTFDPPQPAKIQALLKPYGSPISSSVEEYPNIHMTGAKDYRREFLYAGGKVVIYSVPHINRNYLTTVQLSREFWPRHIENLSRTRSELITERFGKPDIITENKIRYDCSLESNDFYIEFTINNNLVDALEVYLGLD